MNNPFNVLLALTVCAVPLNAQDAPVAAKSASPAAVTALPSLEFLGKKYTLGAVLHGKSSLRNRYYLPNESSKSWVQYLSISNHPADSDIKGSMNMMLAHYKKSGVETEVGKLSTPRVVSFYTYEKKPDYHAFRIYCLMYGPNGKGVIVRTFSSKNLPKNEATFREQTNKVKEAFLSKLAMAKFPKFSNKPLAIAGAVKLPVLEVINEKVTDIQGKGQVFTIDDAFAEKNGAKPGGHRPFTVVMPTTKAGKIFMQARPKVVDKVRFTLVGAEKKMLESIRFTGVSINLGAPIENRLQRAAAIMESKIFTTFMAAHKGGKIGMRYRTKVGPYDAACLLGRFTASDDSILYIKLVAILPEKEAAGIVAVMLLNPSGDEPTNIKTRLQNGVAQQILHSVRFNK